MFYCLIKEIILSAGMAGFLPLLVSAKPNQRPLHSIVSHVSILQELKERFAKKEPQSFFAREINTATESHLKIMKDAWGVKDAQVKHSKLMSRVIEKEKEFSDTHYAVYHGQRAEHYILQDFLKQLYQLISIHAPLKDFEFLRPWDRAMEQVSANRYIDNHERINGTIWNDHSEQLRKDMMCANLALFGNITNGGECTWSYFTNNVNVNPANIEDILKSIFSEFNLNESYIPKILELFKKISIESGLLQQVLIPREKIDECVYLAEPMGTPYRNSILAKLFDTVKKRHTRISSIIDHFIETPEKISNIDALQARVLFSKDIMLNPDSGVKVFRYTTNDLVNIKSYEKELLAIMQELFDDWFTSGRYQKILGKQSIAKTPLVKLLGFITQPLANLRVRKKK